MMTPAQLSAELTRLGFPASERRLVDWRQKGLLPPLTRQGLGRARGVERVWTEPEVLEQAIAVSMLLKRYRQADRAMLDLWFAGYAVPPNLAKAAWLSKLDSDQLRIKRQAARFPGGLRGLLTSWSGRLSRQSRFDRRLQSNDGKDFALGLLRGGYDTQFKLDVEDIAVLLNNLFGQSDNEDDIAIYHKLTEELSPLLLNIGSMNNVLDIIESSTEKEIQGIQVTFSNIRYAIKQWFWLLNPKVDQVSLILYPLLLTRAIAPPIAVSHIHFQRMGLATFANDTVNLFKSFIKDITIKDIIRNDKGDIVLSEKAWERGIALKADVMRIWAPFASD